MYRKVAHLSRKGYIGEDCKFASVGRPLSFSKLDQSLFKFALKFIAHYGHAVLFGEKQRDRRE